MDLFTAFVFGGLIVAVVTLLILGRFSGRRTRDITNKGDQEAVAARLAIEERDIPEMVDAQNDYRRRSGRSERTEEEVRRSVGVRELERLDRADAEALERPAPERQH